MLFALFLIFYLHTLVICETSDYNYWIWAYGSDKANALTTYSNQYIYDSASDIGAREQFATFRINNERYIFGGVWRTYCYHIGCYDDLWKYNEEINKWAYLNGSIGYTPIEYDHWPAYRCGAVGFSYKNKGYLFGGDQRNDLWLFDPTTFDNDTDIKFQYLRGSRYMETAVYGQPFTENSSLITGSRRFPLHWIYNDQLYVWGGHGKTNDTDYGQGLLGDMWSYNIKTNNWIFHGGPTTYDDLGYYGEIGVQSSQSRPPARERMVGFSQEDPVDRYVYMFGGGSSYNIEKRSDLWRYDNLLSEWMWMSGPAQYDSPGTYGTFGAFGVDTNPGARTSATGWRAKDGRLWVFGGQGLDQNDLFGKLNDLWMYDIYRNQWKWVGGSSAREQYGTYVFYNSKSTVVSWPNARFESVAWISQEKTKFSFFGGRSFCDFESCSTDYPFERTVECCYNTDDESSHDDLWVFYPEILVTDPEYAPVLLPSVLVASFGILFMIFRVIKKDSFSLFFIIFTSFFSFISFSSYVVFTILVIDSFYLYFCIAFIVVSFLVHIYVLSRWIIKLDGVSRNKLNNFSKTHPFLWYTLYIFSWFHIGLFNIMKFLYIDFYIIEISLVSYSLLDLPLLVIQLIYLYSSSFNVSIIYVVLFNISILNFIVGFVFSILSLLLTGGGKSNIKTNAPKYGIYPTRKAAPKLVSSSYSTLSYMEPNSSINSTISVTSTRSGSSAESKSGVSEEFSGGSSEEFSGASSIELSTLE